MLNTDPGCLFNKPLWHQARPAFLEEAKKRCRSLDKNKLFLQMIGKISKKQLDALKSFSQAALHYTDLATLQYGVWNKHKREFVDFDLKILRRVTGLSTYYFNRCIVILKRIGAMTVIPQLKEKPAIFIPREREDYNNHFKAAPAVRRLTLKFFILLGFNKERLELNKGSASNKREDKVREENHRQAELNKSCPQKFYTPEPTKKDPNGASQMAKIKDLIKNMRFGKRSPDPDP